MSIRAVVLDFVGVIADTERLHYAAFRDVFADRGWTLSEAAYFDRYIGYDDHGLVREFVRDSGMTLTEDDSDTLVEAKGRLFGRHLESANILFPGAKASIELLAARFPMGIASGALHHEIIAILRTSGLLERFSVIVAADDVTESKPAPETYLRAAEQLGVPASECVAVEDSVAGLEAARSAGMRTIGVTTTSTRLALASADLIVAGLREVSPDLIAALDEK